MPLLVVPLARDEVDLLTFQEWKLLCGCRRVLFERPDHPLIRDLQEARVEAGPFDDEPEATDGGWGLVTDPGSARVVDLARAGATVTCGVANPPDALTAAHAAPVIRRAARSLAGTTAIMARLRSDDGCPWDREQTHGSLVTHLIEEAYEVVDTIEGDGSDADLLEELGDLLLQVAFHSRLAEQENRFDIAQVADGIVAKLVRRHPHVFGDVEVAGAADVLRNWESIKAEEKRRTDAFADVPAAAPALLLAAEVQKRAGGMGFTSSEGDADARARSSLDVGDVGAALFWTVALARARGIDPEGALRGETARFRTELTEREGGG